MDSDMMKPLDLGTGRVCASFDPGSAAWVSIGAPNGNHGFVELSAVPAFDEALRGDPSTTRRHRLAMTSGAHAFLAVELDGRRPALDPDPSDPERPRWSSAWVAVDASAAPDAAVIRQRWRVRSPREHQPLLLLRITGRLDRPALAEITETDPPSPTHATTAFRSDGPAAYVEAAVLPAEVVIAVSGAAVRWEPDEMGLRGTLAPTRDGADCVFELAVGFAVEQPREAAPSMAVAAADRLVGRALTYVRGCTALRFAHGERVILTDHRLLPLSWTRDAYWQALALLAADAPGDREIVADHLRWLWRRCERPDGRWVRSHHADGRRKDLAFQADQHLYPLVELADYWRRTGALPEGVDWDAEVARAWQAALEELDAASGLMASGENAADDPAVAPFIAASQILLWYAGRRVAELADAAGLDRAVFTVAADAARAAFASSFDGGLGPWPYAIDRIGQRVAYHDANDLPIALTPVWGFCAPDDPGWRATMAFAFSPANPAFSGGRRPGLGSVHTPGPWTLGDLQAWIHATVIGDGAAASDALGRLEEVAFADGMLPEAYGADDNGRVRHWFAWPGAALAAMRLLQRSDRLRDLHVDRLEIAR